MAVDGLQRDVGHGLAGNELGEIFHERGPRGRRSCSLGRRGFIRGGFHERGFARGGGGFVDLHAGEGEGAFGAGVRVAAVADDAGDDLAVASDDKLRGNARDAVEAGRGAFIEGVGTALVGVEDEAHIGILRLVDGNPFFKGGDRVARAGGENYHVLILVFRC